MIGIYKITNKQNGKAYIGQSIHCGKRLDEHCKGNQLIDEVIQVEGIENFTFEILKEVNKQELSIWEDYYILKYNTIFPNGYNKRWNCSEALRQVILEKSLGDNSIECQYRDGDSNREFASQDYTVPSYREVNQIIIPDCDIEILKRAAWIQRRNYCKERICTIEDLQRFYLYGRKEANEREILPEQEIFPKYNKRICFTNKQKPLIEPLIVNVNAFNRRQCLWGIVPGKSIEDLKEEIEGSIYYKSYSEDDIRAMAYKNSGFLQYCDFTGTLFYNSCILLNYQLATMQDKQILQALVKQNFINKEWVHLLNSNYEEIDWEKIQEKSVLKKIKYALIGKSVQNYLKEREIYNKFQF